MSNRTRSLLDAITALGIRVLSAGLVFGLQVLLARLMPADTYGGYVTLWTWMLALGSFAALGFAESSVRFLPRYHLRGRQAAVEAFWQFGFKFVLLTSLLFGAAGVSMALVFGAEGPWLTILLLALGLPFLGLEYYLEGVARSFGWFRLAAVPVYILRPILIGSAALALSASGVVLTLPLVGALLVGSMALVTVGMALLIRGRIATIAASGGKAGQRQGRLWLRATLPLLLLSGLEDLLSYADVLLLSLLAEPDAVGTYFAAARSLALAGFVAYAMTLVAGPRFALDRAGKTRAELQASVRQSSRLTFWATLVAVALAVVAGPMLLRSFGPEFVAGQPVMWVLGVGMILRSLGGQAGELIIVLGRQREGLVVGALALAFLTLCAWVLIPQWGLVGAATASALTMAARAMALCFVLWRTDKLAVIDIGLPSIRR